MMSVALLLMVGCCGYSAADGGFEWRVPWINGERFEIIRSETALVTPAGLDVKHAEGMRLERSRRFLFHGSIASASESAVTMELTVEEASAKFSLGDRQSASEYSRSKGQVDGLTGKWEESDPEWVRTYRVGVDRRGLLRDWDELGALELLHGLGGTRYGFFTALLRDWPQGPIEPGARWAFETRVSMGRIDVIPLRLECTLAKGGEAPNWAAWSVEAVVRSGSEAPPHLRVDNGAIGHGRWFFSRDLRRVQGEVRLTVQDSSGAALVRWYDEVQVAALQ